MRIATPFIKFLSLLYVILLIWFSPQLKSEMLEEYEVKAGFLYNFLFFIDWPDDAFQDTPKVITIGVLGNDDFGDVFAPVEGKSVKDRTLVIKRFAHGKYDKSLLSCQLLFISRSEKADLKDILKILDGKPVLTVGEVNDFVELGGMVNLISKNGKIRFEINDIAASKAKINIHSRLKRLAVRVIEKDK